MKFIGLFCLIWLYFSQNFETCRAYNSEENKLWEAKKFLKNLAVEYSLECSKTEETNWDYDTNLTTDNQRANVEQQTKFSKYTQLVQQKILKQFPQWKSLRDSKVKRELKYLAINGPANMSTGDIERMNLIESYIQSVYSKATVCQYKNPANCHLHFEPDISTIMYYSMDYDELAYYFNAWHNASGSLTTATIYQENVEYLNLYANANGFKSAKDLWLTTYDEGTPSWSSESFLGDMEDIWQEIKPMYQKFYAYIRMKLRANSPYKNYIKKCGKIPYHITGSMFGARMVSLEKFTKPYPQAPSINIREQLLKMNYTVLKMVETVDKFYQSLGFPKLTETFYEKSIFEKPADRFIDCHPSAYDFCRGKGSTDFRLKLCGSVGMDDFLTLYHEIGHIVYFMQYTNLHPIFRDGANLGFHEAIGDTFTLVAFTQKHLQCVLKFPLGLDLDCDDKNSRKGLPVTESDINYLFNMALDTLPMIPYSLALDTWRYEVFDGQVKLEDYSKRLWELSGQYQGLVLPNPRPPEIFDPSGRYHVASNIDFLRYFVSTVSQFSFYESMCITAGEYDPNNNEKPLYQCDFSGSKKAGRKLRKMLKLGFSKPWPVALEKFTGSRKISASAVLKYFEPLMEVIEQELSQDAEEIQCRKRKE